VTETECRIGCRIGGGGLSTAEASIFRRSSYSSTPIFHLPSHPQAYFIADQPARSILHVSTEFTHPSTSSSPRLDSTTDNKKRTPHPQPFDRPTSQCQHPHPQPSAVSTALSSANCLRAPLAHPRLWPPTSAPPSPLPPPQHLHLPSPPPTLPTLHPHLLPLPLLQVWMQQEPPKQHCNKCKRLNSLRRI